MLFTISFFAPIVKSREYNPIVIAGVDVIGGTPNHASDPKRFLDMLFDAAVRSGARAALLITDANDAADLVAGGSLERAVLFAGKLLAGRL